MSAWPYLLSLPSRRLPVECAFSPDGLFEARFRVRNTPNLREGEQLRVADKKEGRWCHLPPGARVPSCRSSRLLFGCFFGGLGLLRLVYDLDDGPLGAATLLFDALALHATHFF